MQTELSTGYQVAPVLATWVEGFEAWLRIDGRRSTNKPLRELSVQACLQDVRHFARYFEQASGGQFTPDLMTVAVVRAYFAGQGTAAPASVNRRLASMRTLARWAVEQGLVEQDPTARIPRIEVSKLPPRAKDEGECKRLQKAARKMSLRDQVIWGLMYDAGLRRAEVAGLRVQDVQLQTKSRLIVTGKGGKVREVPIPTRFAKLLTAWLKVRPGAASGALVTDVTGKGISPCQVWRRFEVICAAAGVSGSPHDIRHTFIYRAVDEAMKRGMTRVVAVALVASIAGHSDTRITEMYLRPSEDLVYQVVEGM